MNLTLIIALYWIKVLQTSSKTFRVYSQLFHPGIIEFLFILWDSLVSGLICFYTPWQNNQGSYTKNKNKNWGLQILPCKYMKNREILLILCSLANVHHWSRCTLYRVKALTSAPSTDCSNFSQIFLLKKSGPLA